MSCSIFGTETFHMRAHFLSRLEARVRFHNWWNAPCVWPLVERVDPESGHAAWHENFPWTRLLGVKMPAARKPLQAKPAAVLRS